MDLNCLLCLVADWLQCLSTLQIACSAPFGLVCFVGAMGAMEFGSVEGVRTKFEDVSQA